MPWGGPPKNDTLLIKQLQITFATLSTVDYQLERDKLLIEQYWSWSFDPDTRPYTIQNHMWDLLEPLPPLAQRDTIP